MIKNKRMMVFLTIIACALIAVSASADGKRERRERKRSPTTRVKVISSPKAKAGAAAKAGAEAEVVNQPNQFIQGDETKVYASPPTVFAPGLTTGYDTCMGSTSVGASGGNGIVGASIAIGTTWKDENCIRLKNAHALFAMKCKGCAAAALALLAKNEDVADALKAAGVKVAKTLEPKPKVSKKRKSKSGSAAGFIEFGK